MESSIYPLFASNTRRSFSGCWACRLRRRECDEQRPICQACASLQIDCYIDNNKPVLMDDGSRQERMLFKIQKPESKRKQLTVDETSYHDEKTLYSSLQVVWTSIQ